jgi:hypothetical protein
LLSLNRYLKITVLQIVTQLFLFKNSVSQNLIQNGSFENYTNVDCTYGGFDNGTSPFNHVLDNWYSYNSPDYFNIVCPNVGWYSLPSNIFGYSSAKQGGAVAGIEVFAGGGETKEYIYQQLSAPLDAGKMYCINFYVSRADRIPFAIKNIGAYISSSTPAMVTNFYINVIPQVENQNGFISDTTHWTQIQGCFTAIGGEQYITIGNFNSNSNTDTLRIQSTNPLTGTGNDVGYYYIDDVSLYDPLTVGVNELKISHKFNVFPNPNNGNMELNYDLGNYDKAVMKLYDVTGKLVNTYKLQNTKGIMSMNEQNLYNGIYFYHILVGEKIIKTDKVVIIK